MISKKDEDYIKSLLPEIEQIKNHELQEKVAEIWIRLWRKSGYARIEDAVSAIAKCKLVDHVRAVTLNAIKLTETLQQIHNIDINLDYVIALALLHDICEILDYDGWDDTGKPHKTELGQNFLHGYLGGELALQIGIPIRIVHGMVVHGFHPPHTHRTPKYIEEVILHYADLGHTDPYKLFFKTGQTHLEKRRFFEL